MPLINLFAVSPAPSSAPPPLHVCILGAGAAGLVSAKTLRAAGLKCTIIEQRGRIGGVWSREATHVGPSENPVYDSLKTNLPKEVMQFCDFPFPSELPSFVEHADVQRYLEAYAREHGLADGDGLRLCTRVESITRLEPARWQVVSRPLARSAAGGSSSGSSAAAGATAASGRAGSEDAAGCDVETFDAVLVCNGHFASPIAPPLPGQRAFEQAGGCVVHSSEYRSPEHVGKGGAAGSSGRGVLVIGSGPSGVDISLELAQAGLDVTLSIRSGATPEETVEGIRYAPALKELLPDGGAAFADGSRCGAISHVVLATGYEYEFPFLDAKWADVRRGVDAEGFGEKRVARLYKHLLHLDDPTLAFVGLPFKVIPFPLCEAQAVLLAEVLCGRAALPPPHVQQQEAQRELERMRLAGGRNLHMMGQAQWRYNAELYALAGVRPPRRLALLERVNAEVSARRRRLPLDYRESQYTLHLDEESDGGSWFEVEHPTHPVRHESPENQPV